MADLTAMRLGLAANLAPLAVANPALTISAYVINNPTPPLIWVYPDPEDLIDYHQAMTMTGHDTWHLMVEAYTGALTEIEAQQLLDAYISSGASSVKDALESDKTLGGAAHDLIVTNCRRHTTYTRPDAATLSGAQWVIEVLA